MVMEPAIAATVSKAEKMNIKATRSGSSFRRATFATVLARAIRGVIVMFPSRSAGHCFSIGRCGYILPAADQSP